MQTEDKRIKKKMKKKINETEEKNRSNTRKRNKV